MVKPDFSLASSSNPEYSIMHEISQADLGLPRLVLTDSPSLNKKNTLV